MKNDNQCSYAVLGKFAILLMLAFSTILSSAQSLGMQQVGSLGGELKSTNNPSLIHSIGAAASTVIDQNNQQLDQGFFLACDLVCTDKSTSIESFDIDKSSITIFPNPTNGKLTLEGDKKDLYRYELFNLVGQIINSGRINQGTISLVEHATGMYMLRVYGENDKLTLVEKVSKE